MCRGSGRVDGRPRHGVSVFPTLEGLYRYMQARGSELEGCLIVELEAEPSGDVDFDADEGAMLVLPTEIIRCDAADAGLAAEIERRSASLPQP